MLNFIVFAINHKKSHNSTRNQWVSFLPQQSLQVFLVKNVHSSSSNTHFLWKNFPQVCFPIHLFQSEDSICVHNNFSIPFTFPQDTGNSFHHPHKSFLVTWFLFSIPCFKTLFYSQSQQIVSCKVSQHTTKSQQKQFTFHNNKFSCTSSSLLLISHTILHVSNIFTRTLLSTTCFTMSFLSRTQLSCQLLFSLIIHTYEQLQFLCFTLLSCHSCEFGCFWQEIITFHKKFISSHKNFLWIKPQKILSLSVLSFKTKQTRNYTLKHINRKNNHY